MGIHGYLKSEIVEIFEGARYKCMKGQKEGDNMDIADKFNESVTSWETVIFLYNSALKEVETKLEILNDEFRHIHKYNPIEYIKSRIKTPESIVKKLKRNNYESTIDNMVSHVNDIAGIRLVCSFTSDIYTVWQR